jgi:hypothetical protein
MAKTRRRALKLRLLHRPFWLQAARWLWIVVTLAVIALFFSALPYRYAQLQSVTPQANTRIGELLPEEAIWLEEMSLSPRFQAIYFTTLEVLSALPFFLVAGMIFLRKSDDGMGLIFSMTSIMTGALLTPFTNALLTVQPALEIPLLFLRNLGLLGLILLFFIFPDGRFAPHWAPWVIVLIAIYLGMALFIPGIRPPPGIASFQDADIPLLIFNILLMVLSASAQVYRYIYVSTPLQRQQTKWVVFGLAAAMVVLLAGTVLPAILFPVLRRPGIPALQMRFIAVTITLVFTIPIFPITMAIAILRYRLWDIDFVIRRTLLYTLLTGLLAVFYFSGVALLQGVLAAVGGNQSAVVIVVTTLAIAALINPLRRRVQDFIDRRFYRRKYDAEKALAEFAAAARSETDLAQLATDLNATVQKTLQPELVSVWLRCDANPDALNLMPAEEQ